MANKINPSMKTVVKNFSTVRVSATKMVRDNKVTEDVKQTYEDVKKAGNENIEDFKSKTGEYYDQAKDKISDLGDKTKKKAEDVKDAAGDKYEEAKDWASRKTEAAKDEAQDKGETMTEKVKDALVTAKDKVIEVGENVWDRLPSWEKEKTPTEKVGDDLKKTYEDAKDAAGNKADDINKKTSRYYHDMKDKVQEKSDDINKTTSGYYHDLKDQTSDLGDKAKETAEDAKEKIDENYEAAKKWAAMTPTEDKETKESDQENGPTVLQKIKQTASDMKDYLVETGEKVKERRRSGDKE